MPLPVRRRPVLAGVAALMMMTYPVAALEGPPVIAAASDLQFALPEIAAAFRAETGREVRLTFGSSGNFARQIREGAPFGMYMAADEAYVAALHADGLTRDAGDLYAIGRVVLMVPNGAALTPDENLDNLEEMLASGDITRFAIANPAHAPYGMRAMEALQTRGLWEDLQPVLVLGENVSQAAQFALSGDAEGGIVAWSLALAPQLSSRGRHALIPGRGHNPLRQRMVLLNGAGPVAGAFHAYMQSPAARAVMARHGFVLPDGA